MYLRFVSPLSHRGRRKDVHYGIFQAAFHCRDNIDKPNWLQAQLVVEIEALKASISAPCDSVFDHRCQPGFHIEPVCWFKPEATIPIRQCFTVRALLDLCGVPVSVLKTRTPGRVVFEDRLQIVALAPHGTSQFR